MKSSKQLKKITMHSIMTAATKNLQCKYIGDEKVSPDYTVIPRPGNIAPRPEGGHKIICEICQTVCRTKPDDAKSFCEYVARANGWRAKKKKWRCPEHIKTESSRDERPPVGGIVRLRSRYSTDLKR